MNGNENHWLNFTCEGRMSNRSAIGTRIGVKAQIGRTKSMDDSGIVPGKRTPCL